VSEPDPATTVDREVDARGLACPLPVIELAKAVRDMDVGGVVRLLATDPAAKVDVPVWCRMQRQTLRSAADVDGVWTFEVERVR
jgi:TusA-related sulfurtransferase